MSVKNRVRLGLLASWMSLMLPLSAVAETLTLVEIYPLSGPAAVFGEWAAPATDIALEEINSSGGIAGDQLNLVRDDAQTNARVAVQALQRSLSMGEPIALVSMTSSIVLALEPVATRAKLLTINIGAQSDAVVDRSPYLISNIPVITEEVQAIVRYAVNDVGYRRLGIIYPDDAFGQALKAAYANEAKANGAEIVFEESHALGAKDFTSIVTKLQVANVDAVYIGSYGPDTAILLSQIGQRGVKLPLMTSSTQLATENARRSPASVGMLFTETTFDKENSFAEKYRQKTGDDVNLYASNAYEAVYIVAELAKRLKEKGQEITSAALTEELWENPKITTPLGEIEFSRDGTVRKPIAVYELMDASERRLVGTVD